MTADDRDDNLVSTLLRDLAVRDVSAAQAARLRAYCRLRLARPRDVQPEPAGWVPVALAVTSVAYAVAVVIEAVVIWRL